MSVNSLLDEGGFMNDGPVGPTPEQLAEEKQMARFSKSREFQRLKTFIDSRIAFYETQLPTGATGEIKDYAKLGQDWAVASRIVGEVKALLGAYESAGDGVKSSGR